MKFQMKYDFTLIFGKKGSGKTSMLAKIAYNFAKQNILVFSTEENIENTIYLPFDMIGKYWLPDNCVLLIDELSCQANSRSFKNTPIELLKWFKYQRHNRVKVYAFTQVYDDSDKQLRNLADNMYIAKNMGIFSVYRKIRRVLAIGTNKDGVGQIIDSYEYVGILHREAIMFCSLRKYRGLFNSYSRLDLPDLQLTEIPEKPYFIIDNSKK